MFKTKKKQQKQQPQTQDDTLIPHSGRKVAQELMPLKAIQGSFLRRDDDKSFLVVWVQGTNDSLYTDDQKKDEADRIKAAFVGINYPVSIIKLPKSIDSRSALFAVDAELMRIKKKIGTGEDVADSDPDKIRYELLNTYVRPGAELEALRGNRVVHPTYIVWEIEKRIPDHVAMRDCRNFCKHIEASGRSCHICDHDEILEFLQLYFTPRNINVDRQYGNRAVMPKRY